MKSQVLLATGTSSLSMSGFRLALSSNAHKMPSLILFFFFTFSLARAAHILVRMTTTSCVDSGIRDLVRPSIMVLLSFRYSSILLRTGAKFSCACSILVGDAPYLSPRLVFVPTVHTPINGQRNYGIGNV